MFLQDVLEKQLYVPDKRQDLILPIMETNIKNSFQAYNEDILIVTDKRSPRAESHHSMSLSRASNRSPIPSQFNEVRQVEAQRKNHELQIEL